MWLLRCRLVLMIPRVSILLLMMALLTMAVVQADGDWVIREDGVGPVKIGMTLPELNAALHERFSLPKGKDEQACFYVKPAKHTHLAFMIEDGRLSRADVDGVGISTAEGIQVGDSEDHARRVYGVRLKVEPHKYIEDGHYLTIRSIDGRYAIRFETKKGKRREFADTRVRNTSVFRAASSPIFAHRALLRPY
jgi:hypothetical protein